MKYYCSTCETIVIIGERVNLQDLFEDGMFCPFYTNHGEMTEIPDYETPAQYKERTGKPYSDNGLVFYRYVFEEGVSKWEIDTYLYAIEYCVDEGIDEIVIADPPVQPPDDWKKGGW